MVLLNHEGCVSKAHMGTPCLIYLHFYYYHYYYDAHFVARITFLSRILRVCHATIKANLMAKTRPYLHKKNVSDDEHFVVLICLYFVGFICPLCILTKCMFYLKWMCHYLLLVLCNLWHSVHSLCNFTGLDLKYQWFTDSIIPWKFIFTEY